jgi:D-3-phosphoglycerate dehydrogenase
MSDAVVDNLILDLLEWLSARDRSYEEVIEVWRTSCPKFPVWEDVTDRELVLKEEVHGRCVVKISASGQALLAQRK